MKHEELTHDIIGCAMKVHSTLGPGFLESVYQKALSHELSKTGHKIECEKAITVLYDNQVVGDFLADILVDEKIILEIKANQSLVPANEAQLVNYLTATGIDDGLLLNFGAMKLEFKRKFRTYKKENLGQNEQN